MRKTFFIADLHFGHQNILSFDQRPFIDIDEHDKKLIVNWNNTVGFKDDVYILGDISWHNASNTIAIFKKLNGVKHLIIGNHDDRLLRNREIQSLFVEITEYKEMSIGNGKSVILSHYPIPCFKNHYYGWYMLYGHIHNSWEWDMMEHIKKEMIETYDIPCNMYNVGCMCIGYTPRTLEEIVEIYKKEKEK